MRGQQERSGSLFSYVSIEEPIPASHPLRQGRLKVRHKAAGAGMLVPVLLGLLSSLGPAFCQY